MSVRIRAAKRAQPFVGSMPDKSLKAEANGVGVGGCVAGDSCLPQELLVDVKGLLHTSKTTIRIWHVKPYRRGALPTRAGPAGGRFSLNDD